MNSVHDELTIRKKTCTMRKRAEKKRARYVSDEKKTPSVHDACTIPLRWPLCTMRKRAEKKRARYVSDMKKNEMCTIRSRWLSHTMRICACKLDISSTLFLPWPYHYFETSVNPKANSNSDDRFFSGLAIPLVIPLCLLISTQNRSSELDFAFGSTEVSK